MHDLREFSPAGERFILAKEIAPREEWKIDVKIERYIANIRIDVDAIRSRMNTALEHEKQGAWTTARRIQLKMLRQFPMAEIVKEIRLPVEILTVPPGARVVINGAEVQKRTPTFVRLDPTKETTVVLKKDSFVQRTFKLGPFGKDTDPSKYTYRESLYKAATWIESFDTGIASAPVAWGNRVACVDRNGRWTIRSAKSGKRIAGDRADTFDGVSAGLATDGNVILISSLDGKMFVLDAKTSKTLYTLSGYEGGIYARPTIHEGIAYVVDDSGWVSARNLKTRKRLWRVKTPAGVRASPVVQGNDLVVIAQGGDVTVLRRADGDEVAHYRLMGNFAHAPAVVGEDDLVFASDDGHVFDVERLTGQTRWTRNLKSRIRGTGPVHGRAVFFSVRPRQLVAIDTHTGDVIHHASETDDDAQRSVTVPLCMNPPS